MFIHYINKDINLDKIELFYKALSSSHDELVLAYKHKFPLDVNKGRELLEIAVNYFQTIDLYTNNIAILEAKPSYFDVIWVHAKDIYDYSDLPTNKKDGAIYHIIDVNLYHDTWRALGYNRLSTHTVWNNEIILTNDNHIERNQNEFTF